MRYFIGLFHYGLCSRDDIERTEDRAALEKKPDEPENIPEEQFT